MFRPLSFPAQPRSQRMRFRCYCESFSVRCLSAAILASTIAASRRKPMQASHERCRRPTKRPFAPKNQCPQYLLANSMPDKQPSTEVSPPDVSPSGVSPSGVSPPGSDASHQAASLLPKIVRFADLSRCGDEIWIEHHGQLYRLRETRQGKLILTK